MEKYRADIFLNFLSNAVEMRCYERLAGQGLDESAPLNVDMAAEASRTCLLPSSRGPPASPYSCSHLTTPYKFHLQVRILFLVEMEGVRVQLYIQSMDKSQSFGLPFREKDRY